MDGHLKLRLHSTGYCCELYNVHERSLEITSTVSLMKSKELLLKIRIKNFIVEYLFDRTRVNYDKNT